MNNTLNYVRSALFPALGGIIKHPNNERKFYLRFEIKKYDQNIELSTAKPNNVGKYLKMQHIRKWLKVSSEEVKEIKVCKLFDENGEYFVSDTSYYVPEWLRSEPFSAENNSIPKDKTLVYTVQNNPDNVA